MRHNVNITVRERGKIVASREAHNVWVDNGRQYLTEMVGYSDYTGPTPERVDRIRHMEVGIGGTNQTRADLADAAPFSTSYPAGFDPNATNGHEYRKEYPIDPLISTLERPVRLSGGTNPYATSVGDTWLIDHPDIFFTHMSLYEVTAHGFIDCTAGDLIYGPFTSMPMSELGLLTDESGAVGVSIPYSPVVGYFSFDTILLNSNNFIEIIWRVRFA